MTELSPHDREFLQKLADAGGSIDVPSADAFERHAHLAATGYVFVFVRPRGIRCQLTRLGWSTIEHSHG